MKKVLSVFCLAVILCMGMPANAAPHGGPGGPGGPGGYGGHGVHGGPPPGGHGGHHVVAGPHRGYYGGYHGHNWGAPPPPPPRHHYSGSRVVIGGVLARPGCGYYPYYDYGLGWYDDYYYPRYRSNVYVNFGVPIRF